MSVNRKESKIRANKIIVNRKETKIRITKNKIEPKRKENLEKPKIVVNQKCRWTKKELKIQLNQKYRRTKNNNDFFG